MATRNNVTARTYTWGTPVSSVKRCAAKQDLDVQTTEIFFYENNHTADNASFLKFAEDQRCPNPTKRIGTVRLIWFQINMHVIVIRLLEHAAPVGKVCCWCFAGIRVVLRCGPRVAIVFWNSVEYWELATREAKYSPIVLVTWVESEFARLP